MVRSRAYLTVVIVAILFGILLRWEALTAGFISDDYAQVGMLAGQYSVPRHPLDLFAFSHGSVEESQALMDAGFYPWWTYPKLRLSMLRPLACILVMVDYTLFGHNELAYHLHSMLWWIALVLTVAALYRRLLPLPIASAAILLFAVDESHGLAVMWIANRSALVTLTLVLLGLLAYIRWREDGWRIGAIWAAVLFSLAVAAVEWSISALAYVLAYELLARGDTLTRKLRCFAVAALPAIAYVVLRSALHYGALHSSIYLDPLEEPGKFAFAAAQRIPVFFADLVLGIPAAWFLLGSPWRVYFLELDVFSPDTWHQFPSWPTWHVALGVTAGVLGIFLIRWALRGHDEKTARELRWLIAGALLSLTPMVGSFSSSRLLLPCSVGASAVLGAVLGRGASIVRDVLGRPNPRQMLAAAGALMLAWIHLWNASLRSFGELHGDVFQTSSAREWVMLSDVDDETIANQHVVIIGARDHTTALYLPLVLWWYGRPKPKSSWLLSAVARAHDIRRVSANSIDLMPLGDPMLVNSFETLFRADRYRLGLGDVVRMDGYRAKIVRMAGNLPLQVRFTFAHDVDDPRYLFMYSTEDGLRRVELPPIGETLRLPKPWVPNKFQLPQYRLEDEGDADDTGATAE